MSQPPDLASRRLVGRLLVAIGVLMAGLSGVCTLGVAGSGPEMLPTALLFGGPFVASGALMVIGGRMLLSAVREATERGDG